MSVNLTSRMLQLVWGHRKTLVLCLITALVTAPVYFGFIALLLAPVFLAWTTYSLFVIWSTPARRTSQSLKLLMWAMTFFTVAGFHYYYYQAARQAADKVAAALRLYKARDAQLPAAWDANPDSERWKIRYLAHDGRPFLIYTATFSHFAHYYYDFASESWRYVES